MPGRSPAGPLMAEHRVIEKLITALEHEIAAISSQHAEDPRRVDQMTDFIRTYADRCHHGKEEDILFRRLEGKRLDPELRALMNELIEDHVRGRAVTRRLVEANDRYAAGDASALDEIVDAARELVEFYPVHIEKEDRHFFKPCMEYFTAEEHEQMLADFDEADQTLIHAKYKQVADELSQPVDVRTGSQASVP